MSNDSNAEAAAQDEAAYNFFFMAPPNVQEAYYQHWCKAHADDDKPMPAFLLDYEKYRAHL